MIYFYLECDALDNDIRSLFMAFYPGRAIKRIETKEYACAEGDLFLRVCMSDCAETQCLANEDNTKKKMTMELMQDGTLLEDACECELSDRKDTKTKAKCMLYCLLSKLTKKELPWGTLTGIRPTKIARTMLMEGASDEECIDYMILQREKLSCLIVWTMRMDIVCMSELHFVRQHVRTAHSHHIQ